MDLSPYLESVRTGVTSAASLADDHTRHVAERLGTAIESSTRLALIQALADAAGTISADVAPSSVELRMVGQEPEFVVTVPGSQPEPTLLVPDAPAADSDASGQPADLEDEPIARVSLRLPQSVKARVDEVAGAEGISTNAWLIRAVMDTLRESRGGAAAREHRRRRGEGQQADWPMPPEPPRPPHGEPFGPGRPFGLGLPFGPDPRFGAGGHVGEKGAATPRTDPRGRRGNVQGWVR